MPPKVNKHEKRDDAKEDDKKMKHIPAISQVEKEDQQIPMDTELIRVTVHVWKGKTIIKATLYGMTLTDKRTLTTAILFLVPH